MRLFLSYSRKDLLFVERLMKDLRSAELDVWVDFDNIQGGEQWRQAITSGIEQADCVLVCLSPDAIQSEWVRRELFLAQSLKKQIIPLMLVLCLEALSDYDETRYIQDIQIIDFTAEYVQRLPSLFKALSSLSVIAQPPVAKPGLSLAEFRKHLLLHGKV